jgi:hypothetical protein
MLAASGADALGLVFDLFTPKVSWQTPARELERLDGVLQVKPERILMAISLTATPSEL